MQPRRHACRFGSLIEGPRGLLIAFLTSDPTVNGHRRSEGVDNVR
jgi:hypothetical protein